MTAAKLACDICVVGAGIAGTSVAALLAEERSVVLLERESHPGYHTTGRSVAIYTETLPGAQIGALTRASRTFFEHPPEGFSEQPVIRRRPVLSFGRQDQRAALQAEYDLISSGAGRRWLSAAEVLAAVPILRPEQAELGVLDSDAFDMDVDALHQGWLRKLRRHGGQLLTDAPLEAAERVGGTWRLKAGAHQIEAGMVIDAAGAWGDQVAATCGVRPLGLQPRRRTVAVLATDGLSVDGWPMCIEADHGLYFKADAGRLLVSAMDQTPSPPCDAWADDMDVAEALDRFAAVASLPVRKPLRTWAGLRTFTPDEEPAAGFDPDQPGFFWLVGQGGAGIQTHPALAATAAALALGRPLPAGFEGLSVAAASLDPARFRASSAKH